MIRTIHILPSLIILFAINVCIAQSGGSKLYTYESVPNDPMGVRIYTLDNGLKVYLSVNKEQPRVQTMITVKTGSKNDPADVTGLAHYLEHMVFKGTSKYGTQNWEKEKILLQEISDLYEKHKYEPEEEKKKTIYLQIDSVSNEAAKYAIANEYDKMISGLGAEGTNAFTSLERTAYINDIPATELEKWMLIESERFNELVLRLFHTELEAVYEEFNMGQDNDYRKVYAAMNTLLFPTHPYGTQTTIGEGQHLKNPSMVKIHEYFDKYYVPNNMAIALAGDFDPDLTIAMIDKYFGNMKSKEVNPRVMPKETPQTDVKETTVKGPMQEWISIGYRTGGYHTQDAIMSTLVSNILSNGQAGLFDLNLAQKQLVLRAGAYSSVAHDYSSLILQGNPRDGQSLEQVRDLMLAEVERIKRGDFSEELMTAIIKNLRKDELAEMEANWIRAYSMSDAFIMGAEWEDYVLYYERMEKISKADVVQWVKNNLKNNYCIVYKRYGEDKDTYKVDKPQITPVDLNREAQSDFYRDYEKMESLRLEPEFIDYNKALLRRDLIKDVPFYYIQNQTNDLFTIFIDFDENLQKDKKVKLATEYLSFLGTDKVSAAELKQKFYNLGVQYYVQSSSIYITGLNESYEEALFLLEDLLQNCQPDENALKNLISDTKKKRQDSKKSKATILYSGLSNYAKHGPSNPFNDVFTDEELDAITSKELVGILHSLRSYNHSVLYYGRSAFDESYAAVKKAHVLPKSVKPAKVIDYPELEITENTVYFADYDMVQTQLMMISKGNIWDPSLLPSINMFNAYFGSGLSSIVFQEIRESKALAYSAYAYVSTPFRKEKSHYIQGFIGTQANKLGQAVNAMQELMNNMPKAELQFNESKVAALKLIESERIVKTNIYWEYRNLSRAGLTHDVRQDSYDAIQKMEFDDLQSFFNTHVKGRNYSFCVIGKKSEMDMEALSKLGTVKELSLEELFGY